LSLTWLAWIRQRVLSEFFIDLPPKKVYPDYYRLIAKPMSLAMVREGLDKHQYSDLQTVKEDLLLCFKNAQEYNMPDSQIYKDAKSLHVCISFLTPKALIVIAIQKLVRKQYNDIIGNQDGSDEDGKQKDKPTNLIRLCRTRLQKLVEKTDERCVC
jgi:chromatin structure-remodeling complex subunit RSC4